MKKVETEIMINCTPGRVIKTFVDPEDLGSWWGVQKSFIELMNGGIYLLAWNVSDQGFGYVSTGLIKNYQEQGLLEIEKVVYLNPERELLGPMSIRIEVKPVEAGCKVLITQDGYQEGGDWDWYYNAVVEAWPYAAGELKKYIESLSQKSH